MGLDKTRAFVAIDFPDEVVKEVARVQEILGGQKFTGKLTELENLHLTLKFLGNIDEVTLEKIKLELGKIKFSDFDARLSVAGTFCYREKPRIVWIKVSGKGVVELQKKVDDVLEGFGFKREERFMSHLTIARIKYVKAKKDFVDYVNNLSVKPVQFKVDSFSLMKSELKPIGPVYSLVEKFDAS